MSEQEQDDLPQCGYVNCRAAGDVEREYISTEETYVYCEDHDPLREDAGNEADFFTET